MATKLTTPNDLKDDTRDKYTIKEVLETFINNSPNYLEDEEHREVINAVIIYQTEDGFAHSELHFSNIVNLIGAIETTKQHLLLELLSSGEISYPDDDD